MIDFKNLTIREHELLLKFPAYISLLAANTDGRFDKAEKFSAVELVHIKTYACDPRLGEFFQEVNNGFEKTIDELDKVLPAGKQNRHLAIKAKLLSLEKIVLKLGKEYTDIMHQSMESFKDHVSHAHHNVLVDFLFPIPIKGLSY